MSTWLIVVSLIIVIIGQSMEHQRLIRRHREDEKRMYSSRYMKGFLDGQGHQGWLCEEGRKEREQRGMKPYDNELKAEYEHMKKEQEMRLRK